MAYSASDSAFKEIDARRDVMKNMLSFGIKFLDDALFGIKQSDLILIGAPSGIGKTQLCCNIALANLCAGKRVHYLALEAEEYEIERRLKYQHFAHQYFHKENSKRISKRMSFDQWMSGKYIDELWEIEESTAKFFESGYKNLFLYYKLGNFGVADLTEQVVSNASKTDLIIVDHVHYFDFDDNNENRAMKEIAKTARTLALEEQKPIILVSHLRKRDRNNQELAAGLDEFHGSSDLYKIATKVITIAPGKMTQSGNFETFMRIPKNRFNGGVSRFLGRLVFNTEVNAYEDQYKLGHAGLTRETGFEELTPDLYPEWANAQRPKVGSCFDTNVERQPVVVKAPRRTGAFTRSFQSD